MLPDMTIHHPWRTLPPKVAVKFDALPDGVRGLTDCGQHIWLSNRLLQVERRCTLVHEQLHIELGFTCSDDTRSELQVKKLAARRLIPIHDFADAVRWSLHVNELADALWVIPELVMIRWQHLHPAEKELLRRAALHHEEAVS